MMNKVQFSVVASAAWGPGLSNCQDWTEWAKSPFLIESNKESNYPAVSQMPPMLRRRAGFLAKMALEVAYQCLANESLNQQISSMTPTVFCSRHGDVARATELLFCVAKNEAVSPTSFGLAVHNATAGLFSIARKDQSSHIAIAAGTCTIEHGVIEACSLLADGASRVLLVSFDNCLPPVFSPFEDCKEQPHAWAWLMVPAKKEENIQLSWTGTGQVDTAPDTMPASLSVLQFYLRGDALLKRYAQRRQWTWSRHG